MTFSCDDCDGQCLDGVEVIKHTIETTHSNFTTNEKPEEKITIDIVPGEVSLKDEKIILKSADSLDIIVHKETLEL